MKKLLLSLLPVLIVLAMAVPCKAVLECTDAEHDWKILVGHGFEDSVFAPSLIIRATELRSEKRMYDSIQVVVTTEGEGQFKCNHQFVELEPTPSISSSETWKFRCKKCGAPRFFFTFQGTGVTNTQSKNVVLPGAGSINKGRIVIEVAHQGLILGTMGGAEFTVTDGILKYGNFHH
jgi:hypothetical protein